MRFQSSFFLIVTLAPVALAQSPLPTTSGTGFAGAPYSATETTIRENPDGNHPATTYVTRISRDAEGRTRQESLRETQDGNQHREILVTDPAAGVYLHWTEGDDIVGGTAVISSLAPRQRVTANISELPALSAPSSGITACGPGCTREIPEPQEINGIPAQGVLTTRIISGGDADELVVTNELWTSPELRIIVRHILTDPRTGVTTTNVTHVVRDAPDPGLFRIPAGYQIVDRTGSTAPAISRSVPAGTHASQTNGAEIAASTAPQPPLAVNPAASQELSGTWINVDPNTRGLVQIMINGVKIHAFGACHPQLCDWPVAKGKKFAGSVDSSATLAMTAKVSTSFSRTELTLTSQPDGRLRADVFTHFTDGSRRSDYHSTEYFTRSQTPD